MDTILLFTADRMLSKTDGIKIDSVRTSFDGARYLSFSRDIRFDEDNVFANNDVVSLSINGTTVFTGWILDHDPSLDTNEAIGYRAAGPRVKLGQIIYRKDGSAVVTYNEGGDADTSAPDGAAWTFGQIFLDIVNGYDNVNGLIPGNVIAEIDKDSILAMNAEAPEIIFSGMSVDDCLRYIIHQAGKFGFFISISKKIQVVDFDSTTAKKVYIGQIGETVSDHAEYDVVEANLNWSVAACKTKCTIEGARKRYEQFVNLTPAWDPDLEEGWSTHEWIVSGKTLIWQPVGEDKAAVYRKYTYAETRNLLPDLISEDKTISTEYKKHDGSWFPYQAGIDLEKREVTFPTPVHVYRIKVGSDSHWSIGTLVYAPTEARMKCVVEGDPLSVSIGPIGTAYTQRGIVNEMYIIDRSLIWENVARPGEASARDDSTKLEALATQLLANLKDEQVTGDIILDGLDLGWSLENKVDIENAKDSKWSDLNAIILSVDLLPSKDTGATRITLSNHQYPGGAGRASYSELKQRLLVSQKLQQVEEKAEHYYNLRYLGSSTNLGEVQSSGDVPEAAETYTDQKVKDVVQEAFNDSYFTVQAHDHTGTTQGGVAYASKGAALQ